MGIVALADGTADDASGSVLTINNSGDIFVRQSSDGGATWHRGLAINVAGNPANNVPPLPNATVINLLGAADQHDAMIYGNIAIQAGDQINVEAGTTDFNGIINPAFLPAGGITAADFDSGLAGVGALTIGGAAAAAIGQANAAAATGAAGGNLHC